MIDDLKAITRHRLSSRHMVGGAVTRSSEDLDTRRDRQQRQEAFERTGPTPAPISVPPLQQHPAAAAADDDANAAGEPTKCEMLLCLSPGEKSQTTDAAMCRAYARVGGGCIWDTDDGECHVSLSTMDAIACATSAGVLDVLRGDISTDDPSKEEEEEEEEQEEVEEDFLLDLLNAWRDDFVEENNEEGREDDIHQCKDAIDPDLCYHHFVERPSYTHEGAIPIAPSGRPRPCSSLPNCVNVCDAHPEQAAQFCARSCGLCDSAAAGTDRDLMRPDESLDPWTRAFARQRAGGRRGDDGSPGPRAGPSTPAISEEARWCDDLEDASRLAERGFVVLRGAVPPDELARMRSFVTDLPAPVSLLCGAADLQPFECMEGERAMRERYPTFMKFIDTTFQDWSRSGIGKAAGLGWPLEITEGEFVSINSWPFAANATCVLARLFEAAHPHAEAEGCFAPCADANCKLQCLFKTVVERMPIEETRAVLSDAVDDGDCGALASGSIFATWLDRQGRGPATDFNFMMYPGTDDDNDVVYVPQFAYRPAPNESSAAPRVTRRRQRREIPASSSSQHIMLTPKDPTPGHPRMGSGTIRTWLTMISNLSAYLGWHDWHTDGPTGMGPQSYGRYHKILIMVWKDEPRTRNTTNVRLAHAGALAAHVCKFEGLSDEDATFYAQSREVFERVGCDIPLDAGDVLFFREDVWHRTQNMEFERISFILNVLRYPLLREDRAITMPPVCK